MLPVFAALYLVCGAIFYIEITRRAPFWNEDELAPAKHEAEIIELFPAYEEVERRAA